MKFIVFRFVWGLPQFPCHYCIFRFVNQFISSAIPLRNLFLPSFPLTCHPRRYRHRGCHCLYISYNCCKLSTCAARTCSIKINFFSCIVFPPFAFVLFRNEIKKKVSNCQAPALNFLYHLSIENKMNADFLF